MRHVHKGRHTADLSDCGDEIVVFIIGMRINKPWKIRTWWPVFTAMPRMLRYLESHPDKGLLGHYSAAYPLFLVQYWKSFDHLNEFARNRDDPHLEPWRQFNQKIAASGDVGIWHETYRVPTSSIETIYGNMPTIGLAGSTSLIPVRRGRDSAAARIGATAYDEPVLPGY
jgi:hypothetical protein